ncbi:hypothetical protein BO443_60269 [Burkholderia orbicola]
MADGATAMAGVALRARAPAQPGEDWCDAAHCLVGGRRMAETCAAPFRHCSAPPTMLRCRDAAPP